MGNLNTRRQIFQDPNDEILNWTGETLILSTTRRRFSKTSRKKEKKKEDREDRGNENGKPF